MNAPSQHPLHHLRRGTLLALEASAFLFLLALAAWMALLWRLSQGPLNIDFITDHLESALHRQQPGFIFDIGSTELTWGGHFDPLELQMDHVQISREDKTPVLAVDKISAQLSKRSLIFGSLVPKVIKIDGPALRLIHHEDGHFSFNIDETTPDSSTVPTPEQGATPKNLIDTLLTKLREQTIPIIGSLKQVSIVNAALLYEDKQLNVAWKSKKANVTFSRKTNGIFATADIMLDLNETTAARIRAKGLYNWDKSTATAVVTFSDFIPALASQNSDTLREFSTVNLPFKGSISLELNDAFAPTVAQFVIGSDAGTFNWKNLYKSPVAVKSFYAKGSFNPITREGNLEQMTVDLGGPVAEIKAQSSLTGESNTNTLSVQGTLLNMPIDDLKTFWPDSLTPDPRRWVTQHLSKGIAEKATLDLAMEINPAGGQQLKKLGGAITYKDIKVDYFPPLMPVTGATGEASFDQKSFNLDIKSGMLNDIKVTSSKIKITDLDTKNTGTHSKIDIDVALSGPLKTALDVLDSDPLHYTSGLGLSTKDVAGAADINVNFKFPLYEKLQLHEVAVKADAKINNVLLTEVVADMPLAGGPYDFKFEQNRMTVKGGGKLADMPIDFTWNKDFLNDGEGTSIDVSLTLDTDGLKKFGAPETLHMDGTLPATVHYKTTGKSSAFLSFKGDITSASFAINAINYQKPVAVKGTLDFDLQLENNKPQKMSNLLMKTPDATLAGDVSFLNGALQSARLGQFILGETNISLNVDKDSRLGYNVKISGQQADVSSFLESAPPPQNDDASMEKTDPVSISLALNRLVTGKGKFIESPKMFVRRNEWQRIDQFEIDGKTGKGTIYARYMPVNGRHTLRFESTDAGAALRALGIVNSINGGKITVDGKPSSKGGARDLTGSVILTNFTMVKAPVLARLLNAMSLTGIIELLDGSGIAFKKMRTNFAWTDRGAPDEPKNIRRISLKDGQTSGASLGLTFEGVIDNWHNTYDIDGTIVPVSDLNKLLSSIPLVGDILTAGGEGIFAATYTIKGPVDNPTTTVNPLAVLAPGVLRKIFFEN